MYTIEFCAAARFFFVSFKIGLPIEDYELHFIHNRFVSPFRMGHKVYIGSYKNEQLNSLVTSIFCSNSFLYFEDLRIFTQFYCTFSFPLTRITNHNSLYNQPNRNRDQIYLW